VSRRFVKIKTYSHEALGIDAFINLGVFGERNVSFAYAKCVFGLVVS